MRLIDADAISANIHSWLDGADEDVVYIDRTELFDLIDEAPTIEPKRGEWLWDDGYFCSECQKYAIYDASLEERLFDYCPHCGADMRKESDQ